MQNGPRENTNGNVVDFQLIAEGGNEKVAAKEMKRKERDNER